MACVTRRPPLTSSWSRPLFMDLSSASFFRTICSYHSLFSRKTNKSHRQAHSATRLRYLDFFSYIKTTIISLLLPPPFHFTPSIKSQSFGLDLRHYQLSLQVLPCYPLRQLPPTTRTHLQHEVLTRPRRPSYHSHGRPLLQQIRSGMQACRRGNFRASRRPLL